MGSRKRSRPNPKVEVDAKPTEVTGETSTPVPSKPHGSARDNVGRIENVTATLKDPGLDIISSSQHQRSRWYAGGTWPRMQKSTPSIKVARETILADQTSNPGAAEFSGFEPKKPDATGSSAADLRPSAMYIGKSKETLDMTLPDSHPSADDKLLEVADNAKIALDTVTMDDIRQEVSITVDANRPSTASGWLDWFGKAKAEKPMDSKKDSHPTLPNEQLSGNIVPKAVADEEPPSPPFSKLLDAETPASGVSWFGFWSSTAQNAAKDEMMVIEPVPRIENTEVSTPRIPLPEVPTSPAPGSTWAFWSKESWRSGETKRSETGALAVNGESSQNNPIPAHTSIPNEIKVDSTKQRKRGRPQSIIDEATQRGDSSKQESLIQVDSSIKNDSKSGASQPSGESSKKVTPSQSPTPTKPLPANLLLPTFYNTYRLMENPSIIQQIARLLTVGRQLPSSHVLLLRQPPRIKKALAIGIHGLFPAPLLRTVIGQPTGTSIRFANHAAGAIQRWVANHGYGEGDVEVEKIALEGEGKIAERVDNLWKLLLNWIDHVRTADFILVACHSQGVPVAMMLMAKLIEFGVVTSARIGICAMAGVSLGPFADYKSRLFSGSAAELFDFANPESEVSRRYEDCLRVVLNYGTRITYVGSIDDQLVSLESAIFSPAYHPYIYRAVFVDGRVHAPDFIAHLVGFALKLRNLGVSDHGLIRELSVPLAGSLYTGEGHSRLYDELKIYDAAIQFALETSSVVGTVPLQVQKYEVPTNSNPFQLPWSMRGLLEEDIIKTELDSETKELLQQFEDWKPTTKVLKDVKYRLEAIKSKL